MTFRVYFFAEQAFLSQVKFLLSIEPVDEDKEIELGAICVMACAAAIEAIANTLLSGYIRFEHFDELRISSKIEHIANTNSSNINWGEAPWQDVAEIIKIRNWLMHFKDSNIGLINSEGDWLKDEYNKKPKIVPDLYLSKTKATDYYKSTLKALKLLVLHCKDKLDEFDYLESEKYQSSLIG